MLNKTILVTPPKQAFMCIKKTPASLWSFLPYKSAVTHHDRIETLFKAAMHPNSLTHSLPYATLTHLVQMIDGSCKRYSVLGRY